MESPSYIVGLHKPTTKAQTGRKVWGVDLENVWIPHMLATNANGITAIPSEALGAPIRLGLDKAGQVRFSSSGKPVFRVAKEISSEVSIVRDNFLKNLLDYAEMTAKQNPDGFRSEVERASKAGEPIKKYENVQLSNAMKAKAEAEAQAVREAEAKEAEAIERTTAGKKKELVHA